MKKAVYLMCDYLADPIWSSGGDSIDLEELPLSDRTRRSLRLWAERYDALLDHGLEWQDEREEQVFEGEGRRLWREVSRELGEGWEVGYFSEREGKHLTSSQLE
jgi:hypothetical protein